MAYYWWSSAMTKGYPKHKYTMKAWNAILQPSES